MKKHVSILLLIRALKKYIKKFGIEIVDYWDADLCALGLKKAILFFILILIDILKHFFIKKVTSYMIVI